MGTGDVEEGKSEGTWWTGGGRQAGGWRGETDQTVTRTWCNHNSNVSFITF